MSEGCVALAFGPPQHLRRDDMRTIGLAATLGALALAIPAHAATPNGTGLETIDAATCDGVPGALLHSQGPTFWFGGTHYVGVTFTFTQGDQSNTKVFGEKSGLADTVECTAVVGDGVTLTIEASPVPG
jgi:hypothetical protein